MNFLGRIILVLAIALAGIYCLPDGQQRLEYLMFKLLPNAPLPSQNVTTAQPEVEPQEMTPQESEPVISAGPVRSSGSKLHSNRATVKNLIGENYLDAVLSSGKLERWNPRSFPLKVYIQAGGNVPSEYIQEVKNAFSTWETETKGFVKFVYTNSPEGANYKCIFPADIKNRNCDENGMGTAAYQYFTYDNAGNIKFSVVEFSVYACNGRQWPREVFYSTALHEIGHGLGLRGHSTDSEDLMYPVSVGTLERAKISQSDMTTLRAIYSIIPDVTNIPFTENDKEGLITTADLWGENDSQRADFTIQKIKENIAITPDNPALYAELANAYRDKKDYNSAIAAYSQALKKVDNRETATYLLLDVSDMYIKLGKLSSAEKCLDKAATYGKNQYLPAFYNSVAVKYAQEKNYHKAAQLFDKALSLTNDGNERKMIYQNYRWLAWLQKDKVMYEKYNRLLNGK